ncbi:hypothetical protein K458DRAFT_396539 [Lentithecium fluviatile CBS 122367]|uniref:Uncharacterized protein n=1 Tax=Lentithecium fluviatile CBS 122367 TaxID=1168545 RepID=A0A6G1IF13_9PLEO|nr:hypothetical protein K458DRAFT_396539 [Lentithecium fluviatile CBS 122367]
MREIPNIEITGEEVFSREQRPPIAQGTAAVAFWAGLNACQAQEPRFDSQFKAKLEGTKWINGCTENLGQVAGSDGGRSALVEDSERQEEESRWSRL